MKVCRYYQQGTCKYGEKYCITPDDIGRDLTTESPSWILSAYAPGRDAPEQLFGGYPREQSFEELRLHYMLAKDAGKEQQAIEEAQALYQSAQDQIDNVLRNVVEAARFVTDAENRHPNRHDICRQGTQGEHFGVFLAGRKFSSGAIGSAKPSPFANGSSTASFTFGRGPSGSNTFGRPSALGQLSNPFASPALGQPSRLTSSTFGQPSNPFATPVFGQLAQPAPAFGLTSALGTNTSAFASPALGQTTQPNLQGNAFGQPSQLGQRPNPFASNSQAATTNSNPFSKVVDHGSSAMPAQSSFAAQGYNQDSPRPNPFATQSSNQNDTRPNPFASNATDQSNASSTPFAAVGHPQVQAGTKASFSQNTQPGVNGSFGRSSAFGVPSTREASATVVSTTPYAPGSAKQHPLIESYSSKAMDGRLVRFKGQTVIYKDGLPGFRAFDGKWSRIWFPTGPPVYSKDTEMAQELYDDKAKAQWAAFVQTGRFTNGVMPSLPPPRECTQWDF